MSARGRGRSVALALGITLTLLWSACEAEPPPERAAPSPWPAGVLVDAALLDAARAVVVAEDGRIWLGDVVAGAFVLAHRPAVDGLASLAMVDAQVGWIVGDGVVLRTEDGGAQWERQRLPGPASEHRLTAVAALDRATAVALDDRGRLIGTRDGGAVWVRWPAARETDDDDTDDAGRGDVVCAPGDTGRCLAVGVSGTPGIVALDLAAMETRPVALAAPAVVEPIGFDALGSEPDAARLSALEAAAGSMATAPIEWRIEVQISALEIERATSDRDPGGLFDLIEGRAEEIQQGLERAGVPGDQVVFTSPPPWGFEDQVDEDPEVLLRYWRARLGETPCAHVEPRWSLSFDRVGIDRRTGAALALGRAGRAFWSDGRAGDFAPALAPDVGPVSALAGTSTGWVAVGRQGAVQARALPGGELIWRTGAGPGAARPTGSLRAVAVSPAGETLLAVGDEGRLLWSPDAGASWRALTDPPSSAQAPVPIIR